MHSSCFALSKLRSTFDRAKRGPKLTIHNKHSRNNNIMIMMIMFTLMIMITIRKPQRALLGTTSDSNNNNNNNEGAPKRSHKNKHNLLLITFIVVVCVCVVRKWQRLICKPRNYATHSFAPRSHLLLLLLLHFLLLRSPCTNLACVRYVPSPVYCLDRCSVGLDIELPLCAQLGLLADRRRSQLIAVRSHCDRSMAKWSCLELGHHPGQTFASHLHTYIHNILCLAPIPSA